LPPFGCASLRAAASVRLRLTARRAVRGLPEPALQGGDEVTPSSARMSGGPR